MFDARRGGPWMFFAKKKRRIVRLLLVEDEPLVAFDNEHFLTEASYTIVATVDRVADARAIIESVASADAEDGVGIDLVLVDVHLADGSGVDVARAAQACGVPVMFVTGNCPVEATTLAPGFSWRMRRRTSAVCATLCGPMLSLVWAKLRPISGPAGKSVAP